MINLILKDLRIIKKSFFYIQFPLSLFICFIIYTATSNPFFNLFGYLFIVFFMSYFSFTTMEIYNNRSEAIILNSLPIKRINLVTLKYIMLILYNVIFTFILMVETCFFKTMGINGGYVVSLKVLWISLIICFIYFSIYIPLSIQNFEKTNQINTIMYVLIFLFPEILKRFSTTKIGQSFIKIIVSINNINIIIAGTSLISIFMYLISFFLSVKLYKNKDF